MVLDLMHIFIESGFSDIFLPFFKEVNEEKVTTFEKCKRRIEEMMRQTKKFGSPVKSYTRLNDNSKGKCDVPEFLRKKVNKFKENNKNHPSSRKNTPKRNNKIV